MKKIGIIKDGEEKCPKCSSENLSFDAYEAVDESFSQGVNCNDCDFYFELWANKPIKLEVWVNDSFFHAEVKDGNSAKRQRGID